MQRRLAAILAADVVGFSRLTEQDEEGTLDRLDSVRQRIINPKIAKNEGRIVKLMGDGILAEFPSVVDAVRCAIAIQEELGIENDCLSAENRIALRIGINLGDVIVRGDDLFGDGVNIAARLEQIADPGGIAISSSVHDQIDRRIEGPFEALGAQRLKNISRPIDVWRWAAVRTPQKAPDHSSRAATSPHNLPTQLSSFVGRARQLAEIRGLLAETRLLTLTGAGGCGKTRLACQVGLDVLNEFPDGAWFVALAPLRDSGLLAQTVARALGVREQPGCPLTETIREHLASQSALLILDNCEQILDDCAEAAEDLLNACPRLRILATSREALGVMGELAHMVPGLDLPERGERTSPDTMTRFEAVQLFVDRARLRNREFELTEGNAGVVAEICTRLDGIPLAIELAAARVRVLSAHQISDRLDDAFRLLSSGNRSGLPHHQTLRLAMDWSYSLLSEEEASLFRRLSVFAGGFSLDAVEAISAGDRNHLFDPLDVLQHLVDKSTVVAEDKGTETRYRLLETMRQYGHQKLDGDTELPAVQRLHIDHFLAVAEAAEPNIQGSGGDTAQAEWLDRLEADHDNFRIALKYAGAVDRAASAVALAGALWRFWEVRGFLSEGREAIRCALGTGAAVAPVHRAKALDGAGRLAWRQGDFRDAHACFTDSLALWSRANDDAGEANALHGLARAALNLGDFSKARASAKASLTIQCEIRNDQGVASAINTLGEVARAEGDLASAEAEYRKSLAIFRDIGDLAASVSVLHNLAYTALNRSEIDEAGAIFREALAIARDLKDRLGIFSMLGGLACVATAAGQAERAVELFGAADSAGKSWGYAGDRIDQDEVSRWLLAAKSALRDDRFTRAWNLGRALEPESAIARALSRPAA